MKLISSLLAFFALSWSMSANACYLGVQDLRFDDYTPNKASRLRGAVRITCDSPDGNPMRVALNAGVNSGGDFRRRALKRAGSLDKVYYQIFSSSNFSQIWGDGFGGSVTRTIPSSGTSYLDIYGVVAAGQNVIPGAYSDSISIAVQY